MITNETERDQTGTGTGSEPLLVKDQFSVPIELDGGRRLLQYASLLAGAGAGALTVTIANDDIGVRWPDYAVSRR